MNGGCNNEDILTREQVGRDYEVELKKIRAGNSTELLRRGESLQNAKRRKIESADAHRKMQIRNINELYDWEIAEAEAKYKLAFEEQKERLIIEISSKVLEKARIIDEINLAKRSSTSSSSSSSSSSNGNDHQPYISDSKDKNNDNSTINIDNNEEYRDPLAEAAAIINSSSGRVTRNRSSAKRQGSRHSSTDVDAATLKKSLSEKDIRGDFLSIVKDLENRANRNSSVVSMHQMVPVKVNEEKQTIAIGPVPGFRHSLQNDSNDNGDNINNDDNSKVKNSATTQHASILGREVTYPVGSFVLVRSGLSEEEFSGVLTAITMNEVIVRLGTGARIRVYVNQIRDQRVWIRPDTDIEADGKVYKAVASTMSFINKTKTSTANA